MVSKSEEQQKGKSVAAGEEASKSKKVKVDGGEGPEDWANAPFFQLSTDDVLNFFEKVDNDFKHMSKVMDEFDRLDAIKMRTLENESFNQRKSIFKQRGEIIDKKYNEFWPLMFHHHPNIELFLDSYCKDEKILKQDSDTCKAIKGVELSVENTDSDYCAKLTLLFNKNDLFENERVERTVRIHDESHDGANSDKPPLESPQAVVETTELIMKPRLKAIVDNLTTKSSNDKNKKGSLTLNEVDTAKIPFIVQFCDKESSKMNEFVEAMKPIYNNPIKSLQQAIMDIDDDDEFNPSDDNLESIEEEPEE